MPKHNPFESVTRRLSRPGLGYVAGLVILCRENLYGSTGSNRDGVNF